MGLKNLTRYETKLLMTEMIQLINRSTDTLLTQWEIKCNNQHLNIYDHQALAFDLAEKQQVICNGLNSTPQFTVVSNECAFGLQVVL
jgi:hypothetical protein